jgi:hypothetical protein
VDYARDMLLQYARLYPTLGPHPEGRGQIPGRVFWRVLNDSVWLVNAIQGYDAIRDALSAEDRDTIESRCSGRWRFLAASRRTTTRSITATPRGRWRLPA